MANTTILNEYLVALGMQDNLSAPLQRTLSQGSRSIRQFATGVKIATGALAGLVIAANTGIAKLVSRLADTDNQISQLATDMEISREEAHKLHFALQAMGETLDNIEANPELTRQFEQLKADAQQIGIPDMSAGLEQVRAIQGEFARLRNTVSHGIQWIGHHLFKYLYHPMGKLREVMGNLNDAVIGGLPEWTRRIATVMGSVVSVTTAIVRAVGGVFRALRSVFDMIPTEVKYLTGILTAFGIFLRTSPIGKLMLLFTGLMLLIEDFFVYLDGGYALLGGFWRTLLDFWDVLNKGGGIIERFKNAFAAAMDGIVLGIHNAIDWVLQFWQDLHDSGVIDSLVSSFFQMGKAVGDIFLHLKDIFTTLFRLFADGAAGLKPVLVWLMSDGLPSVVRLLADVAASVANAVGWFAQFEHAREVLKGLVIGFVAVKAALAGYAVYLGLAAKYQAFLAKANAAMVASQKVQTAATVAQTAATNASALSLKKLLAVKAKAVGAKILALGKIGLVIAAIATVAKAALWVKRNWGDIVDFFVGVGQRVVGVFVGIGERISAWASGLVGRVVGFFAGIGDWLSTWVGGVADNIVGVFTGIGERLTTWASDTVESVIGFFASIISWVRDNFLALALFIINPFASAFLLLYNNFEGFRNFVHATVRAVRGFFVWLWERIRDIFAPVVAFFAGVWQGVQNVFSGVVGWFADTFSSAAAVVQSVFGVVVDFFSSVWQFVVELFTPVIEFFANIFGGAFDTIVAIISPITDVFSGVWDRVLSGIRAFVDRATNFLRPIQNVVSGIGSAIGRVFGGGNSASIPQHAMGGVFHKPHIAQIAEDGAEAVIPLTKPKRAKEVLTAALGYFDAAKTGIEHINNIVTTYCEYNNYYNYTTNHYQTKNYYIDMPSTYNINNHSPKADNIVAAIDDYSKKVKVRNVLGYIGNY